MNIFQITTKEWQQIKREIPMIDLNHSYIIKKNIQNKKGNFIITIEVQRI